MIGNIFGSDGLIVLMVALVVIFGGSQLPKLAKNVGAAGHEFRKAQREAEAEHLRSEALAAGPSSLASTPASVSSLVPGRVPADEEKLVMTRSDLRMELAKLMEERDKTDVA